MKKNLAVLLVLSLIVTMLPANTLVAQTLDTNVVVSPFVVETATPPAITSPGGVTFGYQSFREVDRVNFNATHNFAINVELTQAGRNSGFVGATFEWLRNGEVWQGAGGSGVLTREQLLDGYRVRLQLRGEQGQNTRGGDWTLLITLFGDDLDILFEDESRIGVLNVFNEPNATPTPSPGDDDDQGEDDDDQGGSKTIVIVVPPPIIVVNRSVTNIVITHQISRIVVNNVRNPKVRVVVRRGSGVKITGQTIVKVREVNAGLTIVNNVRITSRTVVRNTLVVNISHRVINNWVITDNSEVTISLRNACRQSFDQRFTTKRRSSRRFTSITVVNRVLITNLFEINIRIDNVPVVFPGGPGSDESLEDNDSYMTLNISDLGLTEAQLRRLGMLFFYLQDIEDLESLSYRIVRVYVNDEYIRIPVLGDGWFGLIELPEDFDDEDVADEDVVDEDVVDEDVVDEDVVDEDVVDEDVVDEDVVDEDVVDEDVVDEDVVDEDVTDEEVEDEVVVNDDEDDDDQGEDNDEQ